MITKRRFGRSLFGVTLAAAGLTVLAGDTTRTRSEASAPLAGGVAVLRSELNDMNAAGLPADHPKVQLLQEDLDALERGMASTSPIEAGIDIAGMVARGARSMGHDDDEDLMDNGVVSCEPIPGGLLTAAEIAGAHCTSTPQYDGSSLYVAQRPDGSYTSVRFGADGTVTRQP